VVLAAAAQAPYANCINFGGFAIFQCANQAFFQPPPDFDPNVYVVDPNGDVANISAVFWQIGFGNRTLNNGNGSSGTGFAAGFNGNDSGTLVIAVKDGFVATGNSSLPAGSTCISASNWANTGVDGCCDNPRSVLLAKAADGILNPYYDVYYSSNGTQGLYSLDWQQDYPMAVLLKNQNGTFFAIAAVAAVNRGNTGGDGDCSTMPPTGNPAACDFRPGFYNFRDVNNGLQNPADPNRMNVIPWQAAPVASLLSDTQVNPMDPNSPHDIHLQWTVPTVFSDGSVRPTTNPGMGGGTCTSPGCSGTNDPTRSPGVGVNDVAGKFGGLVHFVFDVADSADPNFTTILQTIPGADPNDSLITIPNGQCFRLRTIFGKQPETITFNATNCRLGKCGDIGYEVVSPRACVQGVVCIPQPAEICNGVDDTCDNAIDEGDPGGGIPCDTGLKGQCMFGITHCVTDPNTLVTSDKCIQLTVPDPNLPSPTDPNRNEDPNDIVADPNHPTLYPQPDVCNGLDDECDGVVDTNNPGGNLACDTGRPGECRFGITRCLKNPVTLVTSDVCLQLTTPDPNLPSPTNPDPNVREGPNDIVADPNHHTLFPDVEICNGKDENCNGTLDDLPPGVVPSCGIGACARLGTCDPNNNPPLTCTPGAPTSEICNGIDDDCNGIVDDPNPNDPNNLVNIICNTGRPGPCATGLTHCTGLGFTSVCAQLTVPDPNIPLPLPGDPNHHEDPNEMVADPNHPLLFPQTETCNLVDDNCDGQVDNFTPMCGIGGCLRSGTCTAGVAMCTPGQAGPTEFCDGLDNDCDGVIDDVDPNNAVVPCSLYFTSPLNGDVMDCTNPTNTQPTLTWHPAQFDKFDVFISTDPSFKSSLGISSGKRLLTTTSWKVPRNKWVSLCKKATDGGSLYIKIQGLDVNVTTKNPLRRFFSPVVVTTVDKIP